MINKLPAYSRMTPIPNALVYLQCICFSILFGIWVLPETILVRHVCLILGAVISIYVIYKNYFLLFRRQALPIYLLVLLFAWALLHLFFLGQDFEAQWQEWTTIWKRSAIGLIFAVGFGMSLLGQVQSTSGVFNQASKNSWWIIFIGIALPTSIYWVKFILSFAALHYGINVPDYAQIYMEPSKYYIHKSAYVFFCLPLLAISLGRLLQLCRQGNIWKSESIIYFVGIILVFINFIIEKDRNGEIYSFFFLLTFFILLSKNYLQAASKKKIIIVLFLLLIPVLATIQQLRGNEYWTNIFSDARIAVEIEKYDHWKNTQSKGLPVNEQGKMLTGSNYERIAWGYLALQLVAEHPLGYGLVEKSFGHVGMQRFPDAKLHQSHSGWLDFTLGMGIPGTMLILAASFLAWYGARSLFGPWSAIGLWGLASPVLLLCTTEVSQKVYIDAFIFLIALVAALNLKNESKVDVK